MYVICFCCETECGIWHPDFERAGISLISAGRPEMADKRRLEEILSKITALLEHTRPLILFSHPAMDLEDEAFFQSLPREALILPVGGPAILLGCGTADRKDVEAVNQYLLYSGEENIRSAGDYIRKHLLGDARVISVGSPTPLPFEGIFSFNRNAVYGSLEQFFDAEGARFESYIGVLIHRSNWARSNLADIKELAQRLEAKAIGVIPVFSGGGTNDKSFREIIEQYFVIDGALKIELLVNLQLFAIRAENGVSIAEQSVLEFDRMNIPVLFPIQSFYLTEKLWRELPTPLSADMPGALLIPEMAGMTEPIIISTRDENDKSIQPLPERIEYLSGRIARLVRLRVKPNRAKKLVIMLHNAVCSGVEATIGKAYGLDAFESAVRLMNRLKSEGYYLEGIPDSGEALYNLIKEKKAISDFRWTAVEDIAVSGGCLYRMPVAGKYDKYYGELPEPLRLAMEQTWGAPPGEGMVLDGELIITGMRFGSVTVMVQPKRGCYGAKCTGEVCKILHDPACPPPHQYLAAYRYIEHVLDADACIDMGTNGSLEFLPGKSSGLSECCWPNVVLGSTPCFYAYHAGVINEGLMAKRRMNAVLLDHLPPPSMGVDESSRLLVRRIGEYFNARALENGQEEDAEADIRAMLANNPAARRIIERSENFELGLREVSDAAAAADHARRISKPHVFGAIPDDEEIGRFIREVCGGDGAPTDTRDAGNIREGLLRCDNEMNLLIRGLAGGYIPAGESGMPDENGRNILPTGRNMFGMNCDKVPAKSAYQRGKLLADQLLESYISDEGRLPERIAMNMISQDVTRTNGEQLSQFLYLLGVEPVWDKQDRVTALRVMDLEELSRPRIDVTVRISGVLRDTWPSAVDMMDSAVLMVAALDEAEGDNFVLKHLREFRAQPDFIAEDDRRGAIRVFGDPPGTFGAGLDLALFASAWKDEADLVKYFIQASAFAYGGNLNGRKSIREFIDNAKNVDLSCDTTSSRRSDVLCNFRTQVQGGYRLVAKHLGNRNIRQYQSTNERGRELMTESLSDNLKRNAEETLLNEFWKQSIIQRGYDGASDFMDLMQSVFSSQCVTDCFADDFLNRLANEYINDDRMREWLSANNPYALEEIARRMLELYTRAKWSPDERTLDNLKANYLSIEGDMEDGLESAGDIQGGAVEIVSDADVESWRASLADVENYINAARINKNPAI